MAAEPQAASPIRWPFGKAIPLEVGRRLRSRRNMTRFPAASGALPDARVAAPCSESVSVRGDKLSQAEMAAVAQDNRPLDFLRKRQREAKPLRGRSVPIPIPPLPPKFEPRHLLTAKLRERQGCHCDTGGELFQLLFSGKFHARFGHAFRSTINRRPNSKGRTIQDRSDRNARRKLGRKRVVEILAGTDVLAIRRAFGLRGGVDAVRVVHG